MILGLCLIYYIGKQFYMLAEQFKKNKWLFAILGVISFYTGAFLTGLAMFIAAESGIIALIDTIPGIVLNLIWLPLGLLSCWALYSILKSSWSRNKIFQTEDVLDVDLM